VGYLKLLVFFPHQPEEKKRVKFMGQVCVNFYLSQHLGTGCQEQLYGWMADNGVCYLRNQYCRGISYLKIYAFTASVEA